MRPTDRGLAHRFPRHATQRRLQHTDEPMRFDSPVPSKDDLVLEENMTITVDFPMVSPGWGSCHLEDLVVITGDGVEPLNDRGQNVIVV